MRFILSFLLLCLAVASAYVSGPPQQDLITSLPGFDVSSLPFRMFSGYIDIGAGKHTFYWFVEAAHTNSTTLPVVLWTNGGPGCSGLIGFFEEHGPLTVAPDGKNLLQNPYSWNQRANMLYIEQPAAGVGFSYADNGNTYADDNSASADNLQLVLGFFRKFSYLAGNDFYLSGESYGGHYIPQLAQQIVLSNQKGLNPKVNLKGYFLGNPLTDALENSIGQYGAWGGRSMISRPTFEAIMQWCWKDNLNTFGCSAATADAQLEVGNVDPYALDFPVCTASANQAIFMLRALAKSGSPYHATLDAHLDDSGYQPCEDNFVTTYLNRPEVKAAIHANQKLSYPWASCSNVLNYNQSNVMLPVEDVHKFLIAQGNLKLTVYSGDDDSVCGPLGSQKWINELGLPVVSGWAPWTMHGQVSGYINKFKGLTFATVHTAGHTVPQTQPERALKLFTDYISGALN